MSPPLIVAIDGPAGAGKSTLAKAVASRLDFALVDTGAIYRCVALAAVRQNIEWSDEHRLFHLLPGLRIDFQFQENENQVFLEQEDVSQSIRTPEISRGASVVSAHPQVRAGLLDLQRKLAKAAPKGAVLEGRDIGTVVFPDADVKLYITASDEVRAGRRQKELQAKGWKVAFEVVLAEQKERDHVDSHRAIAPLQPAADAMLLDTSYSGISEVVEQVIDLLRQKTN